MTSDSHLLIEWSEAEPSELASIGAVRRAQGLAVFDMITANPHDHGLVFPQERLAALVSGVLPRIGVYRPDPLGLRDAREAIAAYERLDGAPAVADHILLTPGTSFAYFLAFRLLLDGCGEVLVPRPTYPLFDDLARLAGARTRDYHLTHDGGTWSLDPAEIEFQITPATRAIALVSPHHPTGMVPSREVLEALAAMCSRRGLALVVDEVYREFILEAKEDVVRASNPMYPFPLVLTLNGISKMFSLPGWKGGWISVTGEEGRVRRTMSALSYATDAFLPVSDVTAGLIPALLEGAMDVTDSLTAIVRGRQEALGAALDARGFGESRPQGGAHRVVGLPLHCPPDWAAGVLGSTGWLVHPGGYYGVDQPTFVVSCVREPSDYGDFAAAIMNRCERS